MKMMRVKTRIVFEVDYPLAKEFYDTGDEEEILKIERGCIADDPVGLINAFQGRDKGILTVNVERG